MKIISYNVRGLGRGVKWGAIRRLVKQEGVDMICLQETKKEMVDKAMCQALWGHVEVVWELLPATNSAGGILCLWGENSFKLQRKISGPGFILMVGEWVQEAQIVTIVTIYSPCDINSKRSLWDTVKQLRQSMVGGLWCILGDFNSIRRPDERYTSAQTSAEDSSSREFNEWIQELEVVEVPWLGRSFTWYRPNGTSRSRLDRFLVSHEWLDRWPNSTQVTLARNFSDHCPIVLRSNEIDWGPKPFRILDCWLLDRSFKETVYHSWTSYQQPGWGGFILKEKIKNLKNSLKRWNRDQFGDTFTRVKKIESELNKLEEDTSQRELSQHEIQKRKQLQEELWTAAQAHESILRQKSRSRWIKEGDCNSRFFHMIINANRSRNSIKGVLVDGAWTAEPHKVKEEAKAYFSQRFSEPDLHRPKLDGIHFQTINQQQNSLLVAPFAEEVVRLGGWDCRSDIRPGPDGLNFKFIKRFWQLIKPDILRFLDEFHVNSAFPRGCNASFLALIPKVADPQFLNDYRPISLIGCMYKIVAKLLAKRLKKVLPTIINETQSAFIEGRHLLQSVLIANEVIDEAKRSTKSCCIFKVDFEKAYDSVSWDFLFYMLNRSGFNSKWISWMEGCLKSASISVLINGSPTSEFIPQRGLRQGDPLAPFLFNVVAEALNGLMRTAVEANLYKGFNIGDSEVSIRLLQYADDTIFFGEASMDNLKAIKAILRTFELVSGLKINFAKSSFGAFGMNDQWKQMAARYLNCRQLVLPFVYLGIPIGANPRRAHMWEPIIQKCERRLARWQQRFISFGGRVALIQSVLTSIPIYYFSFFRVPQTVISKLIKLQRKFLWGGGLESKKIAWISWEKVCLPKHKGGLGIKEIETFNLALLGKWMWNLMQHQGSLWVAILEAKYGGWRGLTEEGSVNMQSIWWRDLKRAIQHSPYGISLQQQLKWKVEAGDKVKFWEDRWICNEQSLAEKYPRLYLISSQQQQLIGQMGEHINSTWEWRFSWRRSLFDSEIDLAITFLSEVEGQSIHHHGADSWEWVADQSGIYSTQSAYEVLLEEAAVESIEECFEVLWKIRIPSKVAVFAWRLLRDRLPTKSNLRDRQVQILDMTCPFCRRVEEDASHLFIHCSKIQPLWWDSMSWINLKGALPLSIKHLFMQYSFLQDASSRNRRWQYWWLAITWSTWQLRNKILFSGATFDGIKLVEDATFLMWTWLHNLEKDFTLHFNQWSSNFRHHFLQQ